MSESRSRVDVLVLDFSVIAYNQWLKIASPTYHMVTGELEDFAMLVTMEMLKIVSFYEPNEIVIAIDPPGETFRHKMVRDYYNDNIDWYQNRNDIEEFPYKWVYRMDNDYYGLRKDSFTKLWVSKKLSKKNVPIQSLEDSEWFVKYEKGCTPAAVLQKFPDVVGHVSEFPHYPQMSQHIKQYKGQRNKETSHVTTHAEFKEFSRGLAVSMAKLFNAKAPLILDVEADDIAYFAVKQALSEGKTSILLTSDKDLYQTFCIDGATDRHTIYDLYEHAEVSGIDADFQWYSTMLKALGGDTSDYLNGMTFGDKAQHPTVTWENGAIKGGKKVGVMLNDLLSKHSNSKDSVVEEILELGANSATKNLDMVFIERIPDQYRMKVLQGLLALPLLRTEAEKETITLANFGLTKDDIYTIVSTAGRDEL